ncbi:MAG: response regulator, partial [Acidobacteria bacterium]|nr:response regulator [Acidobacteriota bacterium]
MNPLTRKIRVLVVDDSAIVRKVLADAIRGEPDMEVVAVASDPFMARDLILQHHPDVLTLDIEMPRMDGLTFLRKLMEHHPIPVIIVSSLTQTGSATSVDALRIGAIDVIPKPGGPYSVGQVTEKLKQRIRLLRTSGFKLQARTASVSASSSPGPTVAADAAAS